MPTVKRTMLSLVRQGHSGLLSEGAQSGVSIDMVLVMVKPELKCQWEPIESATKATVYKQCST